MNYIDCHVHIDFYDNPKYIMDFYEKNKIYTIFVTNLPELFKMHYPTVIHYKFVRLALGFHPELISRYQIDKDLFTKCIEKTNYLGEIGGDFSLKQTDYNKRQLDIFDWITKEYSKGRVLTIHSRGCEESVLEILIKNQVKSAIFHWYTGRSGLIKEIADSGYYFSINPNMIKSKKGLALIKEMPIDKILFESDGPFSKVNKKVFTPDVIAEVYEDISKILKINFKEVVFNNFRKLLVQASLDRQ